MKITDLKINGIRNPVGFAFPKLLCSWKVTDTEGKKQERARIEISRQQDFDQIEYQKEDHALHSNETPVEPVLAPCTVYYWRVRVWADNGETAVSGAAFFETGKMEQPWTAKWIGAGKEDTFHPVLRKRFQCRKRAARARLYICGLGLYEAYLNGEKAGDEYLAPFLNDYLEYYQYQTYDVTGFLKEDNTLEILLGKGWYMGVFGLQNKDKLFGDEMKAIAELQIVYEDGSREVIPTDESWEYKGSDIEESGIYFGEILNRLLWEGRRNPWKRAVEKEAPGDLRERHSLPVKAKETLRPVEILHTPAGEVVADMGQNHAGYMEFTADFPKGTRIVFECGEVLQKGNFYNGNYRDAKSVFVYVSDGRKEVVRPHFTYFGYRYLRITGWPGTLGKEDITARVVYSDLDRTGFFETSNGKINRLYENCVWGQKSNFLDLPTDCPQRGERLGWTGDAQVFAPTASYNMDTRAFYRKFLEDLRSEQLRAGGGVPNYIPSLGDFGGVASAWADAATFIPSQLYRAYGNLEEMKAYYPLMRDWVEYMYRADEEKGRERFFRNGFQFGDWLALDGFTQESFKGSTEDDFIGTAYYCQSAKLTGQMAGRLGYSEDAKRYEKLSGEIREAILREYFTPSGRFALDTQASYILALKFGLYPDKERLKAQFQERLRKDSYRIKCGFVGAPLLCTTLCENGMERLAYDFLFQEGFPSWLYCVNLGATTIWERWNSILPDGTISGTGMNSLNHYAYGSVVEFFYAWIAGIRPLEPGFRKAVIAPVPDMRLRWCRCAYDSVCGRYVSNWEIREDGTVSIHVEVPFGCEAEAVLPGKGGERLTLGAGTYDFEYMPEKDFRQIYDEQTRLEELADDPEAMEILKELLPGACRILESGDVENRGLTLPQLGKLFYMGFTPEAASRAGERIYALKRYEKTGEQMEETDENRNVVFL